MSVDVLFFTKNQCRAKKEFITSAEVPTFLVQPWARPSTEHVYVLIMTQNIFTPSECNIPLAPPEYIRPSKS